MSDVAPSPAIAGAGRWRGPVAGLAVLVAAIALPRVSQQLWIVHVLNLAMIYAVLALGLQLIFGYAGQISVGHAAFYAAGAYASTLLTMQLHWPFLLSLVAAALVAGALGGVMAPISRLSGHYVAIATLAFGQIVTLVLINWESLTQGPLGIRGIPSASIGPLEFKDDFSFYYLALTVVTLVYLGFKRLVRGRFGRSLAAIRQNQLAAAAMGVNPTEYKVKAFMLGCASAGLAGSLFAHWANFINPNSFSLVESIAVICMVVIGGLGSFEGAIVGALLLTLLPEYGRGLKDLRMVVYGGVITLFMIFMPGGLVGLVAHVRRPARAVREPAQETVESGVAS